MLFAYIGPVDAVITELLESNETVAIGINCVEHRRDELSKINHNHTSKHLNTLKFNVCHH